MKTKLSLIAAVYCGLSATGSAFTLDFVSVPTGTVIPPNLTIAVAGYGDVQFSQEGSSNLVVDNQYASAPPATTSPSLNFDANESVKITFLGAEPTDIDFAWVGVSIGETFNVAPQASPNEFIVTLVNIGSGPSPATNSGAGLYQINFNQVPEPSSALLGLVGATMLVIRRKR